MLLAITFSATVENLEAFCSIYSNIGKHIKQIRRFIKPTEKRLQIVTCAYNKHHAKLTVVLKYNMMMILNVQCSQHNFIEA